MNEVSKKNIKKKKPTDIHFVVGIGSSTEGVEALRGLFGALQDDVPMTFIVAQHLAPSHKSRLVEILAQSTRLKVQEVNDGQRPEKNVIYVTPPNADVYFEGGRLRLKVPHLKIGPKSSVDYFFRSLADNFGASSIGIILSGAGSDGALGVRAIKAAGGFTISQKASAAKYDGMLKAAKHTGAVDLELSPEEIAKELSRFGNISIRMKEENSEAVAEDHFEHIFAILEREKGISFASYKSSSVRRSVERRIIATGCASAEEYAYLLRDNPSEANNLFHAMITSFAPDSLVVDEDHQVKHIFGRANQYLSFPIGEATFTVTKLLLVDLGLELPSLLCRAEKNHALVHGKQHELHLDDEIQRVQMCVAPLTNNHNAKQYLVSFHRTSARVPAEEARILQSRMSSIIDNTPAMVSMKDLSGVYIFANNPFCAVAGRQLEEVVGSTDEELFGKDAAKKIREKDFEVLKGKGALQFEERHEIEGQARFWTSSKFTVLNARSQPYSVCTISLDITDRLKDQQTILSQQEELSRYSRFSALGEIAAGISHEINTPLNVITANTDILKRAVQLHKLTDERILQSADDIERMVKGISHIVRGLKTVAGIDPGSVEETSVQKLIQDALKICQLRLQRSEMEMRLELPEKDIMVCCYPIQIMQVVVNLVNNSLEANADSKKPWIKITLEEQEEKVMMTVVDSGNGIDASLTEKIMTPFFSTKRMQNSTGMGLSLSRAIARRHNGDLVLDPTAANTTFHLEIAKDQPRSLEI